MKVFSQNKHCPSQVLFAFDEVANPSVEQVRFAVAYSTYRGCNRLVERLTSQIGTERWGQISKTFVTSLDFGLTDPSALEYLDGQSNSEVYIANPEVLNNDAFRPSKAYHPKLFLFDSPDNTGYLTGSANLTESALISNTELVIVGNEMPDNINWQNVWERNIIDCIPLTEEIVNEYKGKRVRPKKRPVDPDPEIPQPTTTHRENPVFLTAITSGQVLPMDYNHFWLEAGSMSSGGSGNQLELPRGANKFFGFSHDDYGDAHITIGNPILTIKDRSWRDRPLTWHGNNKMERINLPTVYQGGYDYRHTALLFRRHDDGFEIKITPWGGVNSQAWRTASEELNTVLRLGSRGTRICGFF